MKMVKTSSGNNALKKILTITMAVVMMFAFVGCGKDPDTGITPSGEKKGTVTVSIPAASSAEFAWKAMVTAYKKVPGNEKVSIKIETNTDAADYQVKLLNSLVGGVNNVSADIVVANEAGQYLKSSFADYMPYLAKQNPYSEDKQVWRDTLESAAYATYGADDELYMLSFDTTQVFIAYNKAAFAKAKVDAADIKTWDDLVVACEKLSTTASPSPSKNYIPMSFGGNKDSMGMPLGWLVRAYADQYFRDFADVAHSKEGDYTYDIDVDADYTKPNYVLAADATVEDRIASINSDNPTQYTSNPLRAMQAYFNFDGNGGQGNEFNPKGERWQDMMSNLYDIFGNPKYLNDDLSSGYGNALGNMYTTRAGMAIVASDFLSAYSQQNNGLAMEDVLKRIGIMYLPPMTDHADDGVGAPVSNYTRSLGGPNGFFGVVNKNKAQTDLAMDFLMYVFSKQGQEVRLQNIDGQNGSINGPLLVKDVVIPEELKIVVDALKGAAGGITYFGESDYNPFLLVSDGLKAYNGMREPHVEDEIRGIFYNYFNPNVVTGKINTVAECGNQIYATMSKYWPDYLKLMGYRTDSLNDVKKNPEV